MVPDCFNGRILLWGKTWREQSDATSPTWYKQCNS